jgi:hypothetical protein
MENADSQMSLRKYFEQPETPSRNSPVGVLMVRILEKFPGIAFEEARSKAHELLVTAAGRPNYRMPAVYSEAELVQRRAAVRAAFSRSPAVEKAA